MNTKNIIAGIATTFALTAGSAGLAVAGGEWQYEPFVSTVSHSVQDTDKQAMMKDHAKPARSIPVYVP